MEIIISGYGINPDKTIAHYSINGNNVSELWSDSLEDPSFVCEGDGYLFAATENQCCAIVSLLQREDSGFQLLDQKEIEGGLLCHITYSSKHKALFGACYETGTIFSVRVDKDRFGELLYHEIQKGTDSASLTRAHGVFLNKDESELITVNIALDQIYFYRIEDGSLSLKQILKLPEGIGPRHISLSEDESLLYIITEYSNEILIYRNGTEKILVQRISTLREGFDGISNCSTLCFSKDRRYLYTANRGAQTITLFKVNADGTLCFTDEYDCGGKHPRHMVITKDGNYLVICNQFSVNTAVFLLDKESGALKEQIASIGFKIPSCVYEL